MNRGGSEFYAALIHEVKNSLGMLSTILDGIPSHGDATHDEMVEAARHLCHGSVERLRQALLVYRSANGALEPAIDAHSPHDLVAAVGARANALSRGRLRVEVSIAPDVPALWFFDRDLVEMALINAVHNSLRYARQRIGVEAVRVDGFLALSVRDDSDGYPDHILAGAAAGSAPVSATGTGLGLLFGRLIAESHVDADRVGALRLENDGGAVFRLLLP